MSHAIYESNSDRMAILKSVSHCLHNTLNTHVFVTWQLYGAEDLVALEIEIKFMGRSVSSFLKKKYRPVPCEFYAQMKISNVTHCVLTQSSDKIKSEDVPSDASLGDVISLQR